MSETKANYHVSISTDWGTINQMDTIINECIVRGIKPYGKRACRQGVMLAAMLEFLSKDPESQIEIIKKHGPWIES